MLSGPGSPDTDPLDDVASALRRLIDLIEAGTFPGWTFRRTTPPIGEGPGQPSIWPVVDTDGATLGAAVRCGAHGPEPTDAAAVSLLQIVALLVASERRRDRSTARADRAEQEALLDGLTGLPNRRAWELALQRDAARRERTNGTAVIAVIDLDELKLVNDMRGHLAGDALLRTAADTLVGAMRQGGAVARVGGDEFAVLATDWETGDPSELSVRLTDALHGAGVVASVGVALHHGGLPAEDAYEDADRAMYRAKRQSKG